MNADKANSFLLISVYRRSSAALLSFPLQQNVRVRRHVGLQLPLRILHLDLDPVNQLDSLLLRLNLLGRELRLGRDERDPAVEGPAWVRIRGHTRFRPDA